MFYYLLNKEYRLPFLILIAFGFSLYWIDSITEWLISNYSGIEFSYYAPAHLKLIYILLGVVFIGLTSAVSSNENTDRDQIATNYLKWVGLMILFFLIGEFVHVVMVSNVLIEKKSMMELEQNIWLYTIADYLLVIGFSFGGFLFAKPLIHQN
jgi:uncharacterized membrane protein